MNTLKMIDLMILTWSVLSVVNGIVWEKYRS